MFTENNDINILQESDSAVISAGMGDDTYIVSPVTLTAGQEVTLSDTQGSNTLQLINGLTISSSLVVSNALQLTLSNGAKININGADTFTFNVGGNAITGEAGLDKDFSTFAQENLGVTVPAQEDAPIQGGETIINSTSETHGNDNAALLSIARSESVHISGIDNNSLLSQESPTVAALYEGDSWLNYQNTSESITYSFNESLPPEYINSGDATGWQPLASNVREVVDEIISISDGLILPDIEENSSNGQIRFNMVETEGDTAAYAYFPGSGLGGDVFLGLDVGSDTDSGSIETYGAGRSTIVHELGHALGLTHPFEGASILHSSEDHSANTVMSYTDFRLWVPQFTGTQTGLSSEVEVAYNRVAPDHFMLYDIAALQSIYGPDTNYQASDTTYTIGDTPFYTTLWDAGGYDTLDLSGTGHYNVIDLTPGTHSNINFRDIDTQIADQQAMFQDQFGSSAYDDWVADVFTGQSADIYTGENALGIAWGTILEKVIGGPEGNKITDNAVDNYLTGGAGDDLFHLGAGGFDTVDGGGGYDLVMLEQYSMGDVELGSHEDAVLLVADGFAVQMQGIAGVQFADQLYTVV